MSIINKILVPVDGSDHSLRALKLAVLIANKFDSKIKVLHVINISSLYFLYTEGECSTNYGEYGKYVEILSESGTTILEKAYRHAKKFCKMNIEITTKLVEGKPADMIILEVEKENCDHIFIGSRGMDKIQELLLGSVSRAVVHRSNVPVTVVK